MDTAESRMRAIQNQNRIKTTENGNAEKASSTGGKLRFMIALVFFLSFFVLKQKDMSFMGITGEKIYETVCENAKGFDFIKDFPYTLDD